MTNRLITWLLLGALGSSVSLACVSDPDPEHDEITEADSPAEADEEDVAAVSAYATAAPAGDFFVSPTGSDSNPGSAAAPFKTLSRARDAVRAINGNMTRDLVVYLRSGTHSLGSTFVLDARDSGTNGYSVIYRNYPNEKPIVSGGKAISGFTLSDSARNIYRAYVGTSFQTRQLYVNAVRAQRARGPQNPTGFTETATGYTTTNTAMQSWGQKSDIEIVGFNEWKLFRCPVSTISGSAITMQQPCWRNAQLTSYNMNLPTWIENAYELLDQEGEWYLNRATGMLYYKPRAGEDMATAKVYATRLEVLVSGAGTVDAPLHHVTFRGLTFNYAGWLAPSTSEGYAGLQTGYHFIGTSNMVEMHANLRFRAARSIRFERNVFRRLGADALRFGDGSQDITIIGNRFEDISGAGIALGDVNAPNPSDTRLRNRAITIKNNYITRIGAEYFDAPAIFGAYLEGVVVDHNELYNLPYSGIALGWGWGQTSYAKNNTVSYNYIRQFTKVLRDSAAVYTLSPQPGTTVHHNYITEGINPYGCLYPDEGSANTTWTYNVCRNVREWLHIWTTTIHDNTFEYNYADTTSVQNNGTNNTVRNNTFVLDGSWPATALSIMSGAGLEAAYADIRP